MKEREGIKDSLQEIVKVFSEMDFTEIVSSFKQYSAL